MLPRATQTWAKPLGDLVILTLLAIGITAVGCRVLPWENVSPDFICYWTAAELVASGHTPYDAELQARIQHDLGWDTVANGLGFYRFVPYFYPPWLALGTVLLLPLGYAGAKMAWLFMNVELTLLTAYLLRHSVPPLSPRIPLVLLPVFIFTLVAGLLGQTSILILFLMAACWRLLAARRDHLAGFTLAWLTLKPQLTGLLLLALLLWGFRQRRWALLRGFGISLALLCLVSFILLPSWPLQMLSAPGETPPPTVLYPSLGNSWFLIGKTAGLPAGAVWSLYLVVALPFVLAVLKSALDADPRLTDVFSLAILAAFFVAPYARHYDFPVLLIPALVLIGTRLSERAGALLLMALVLLPYTQFIVLHYLRPEHGPSAGPLPEFTFFWVPLLLTALWLATAKVRSATDVPALLLRAGVNIPRAGCIPAPPRTATPRSATTTAGRRPPPPAGSPAPAR
jgi:hypothetical protein